MLIACIVRWHYAKASFYLFVIAFIWFVLAAMSPLGLLLIKPLELRFHPPSVLPTTGLIVVLSGAESLAQSRLAHRPEYNGQADRQIAGATLAVERPAMRLAIAGGVRDPGFPTADVDLTAQTWQDLGIPEARILKIYGTLDTCANAQGVAALHLRPVILVTSAFHMPRSVACFRAAGIEPIPYPVDFQEQPINSFRDLFKGTMLGNLQRIDLALHEWIGLAYYRLRGRTRELFPRPRAASAEPTAAIRQTAKSL